MKLPYKAPLANLPTPLVTARRLSEEIGIEILLKRDDLTGVGLGGNKARAVEFHVGAAEAVGAEVFVTGGGPRSNWVLTAAAGAVQRGMAVELVMFGDRPPPGRGSLDLLDRLEDVAVTFTGDPARPSVDPVLASLVERLEASGRRPYAVGRGGAGPVGSLGYVEAVDELEAQLSEMGAAAGTVWLATGSCGTQAGLVAGYRRLTSGVRIVGASVHRPLDECRQRIRGISDSVLDMLAVRERHQVVWDVLDERDPDPVAVEQAGALMAQTEGVFLDPEYGSPALAALVREAPTLEAPIVLLVTGGTLNLFLGSSAA